MYHPPPIHNTRLLRLYRLRLSGLLSFFLGDFLATRDGSFGADTAEYKADAEELHLRQAVAEGDDGEHHGEHLASDGDGHEKDGGEGRESVDCNMLVHT